MDAKQDKQASKQRTAASLPHIPKELIDRFVSGPMSAEAVNAAAMAFKKALIERALGAELSLHLGNPAGADKPVGSANHRDRATGKTVLTEDGPLRIKVPRHRAGGFEPVLIPKHERRFTGFDDKIVAMYARGMTIREIQGFLAAQYGTQVSPEFISSVTEAVMGEVTAGQSRPLEPMYPAVLFDALRVKIREDAVGIEVSVFMSVSLERQVESALKSFEATIDACPEVMECYLMTGDSDYLLRVVARDLKSLQAFITDRLARIPGVASIRSSIAIKQVKYKTALPLRGQGFGGV